MADWPTARLYQSAKVRGGFNSTALADRYQLVLVCKLRPRFRTPTNQHKSEILNNFPVLAVAIVLLVFIGLGLADSPYNEF
jgi:hypothetical protein